MAQVVFAPEALSNRLKVVAGEIALDGSNPTSIDLSAFFKTAVVAVSHQLGGSSAPGVGTSVITYAISGTTVSLYAWKPTSGSDPTLVASTGTETVSYVAVGY